MFPIVNALHSAVILVIVMIVIRIIKSAVVIANVAIENRADALETQNDRLDNHQRNERNDEEDPDRKSSA